MNYNDYDVDDDISDEALMRPLWYRCRLNVKGHIFLIIMYE